MARRPNSSIQTRAVVAALMSDAESWRHGYDLARETALSSGTLYPILMRLEQAGWLEARWEDEPAPGKPRRHLYRFTATGASEGARLLAERSERSPAATRRSTADGTTR